MIHEILAESTIVRPFHNECKIFKVFSLTVILILNTIPLSNPLQGLQKDTINFYMEIQMTPNEPLIKQPLSVGSFLDLWFSLYKRFFFQSVGLVLLLSLTRIVILPLYLFGSLATPVKVGIDFVLSMVIYLFIAIAFLKLISQACLGEPEDWKIAIATAKKSYWGVLKCKVAICLWTTLCFVCLFFPGLIAFMNRFLVSEIMIFEGLSFKESWIRSKYLVDGTRRRLLLFYLFPLIMQAIINGSLQWILTTYFQLNVDIDSIDYFSSFTQIFFFIIFPVGESILFLPACAIFYTLYYYDTRVRKEALDLELESQIVQLSPAQA